MGFRNLQEKLEKPEESREEKRNVKKFFTDDESQWKTQKKSSLFLSLLMEYEGKERWAKPQWFIV